MNKFILSYLVLLLSLLTTPVQAQTCNNAVTPNAPDSRYTDNGDGTVTDLQTGLMWKQCAEELSGPGCTTGSGTNYNWQQALQAPGTLNTQGGFAGHADWRVPNIKELSSIIEFSCSNPSINLTQFPNTAVSYFWSSSLYAGNSTSAWTVYSYNGSSNYNGRNNSSYKLRLVRSGLH